MGPATLSQVLRQLPQNIKDDNLLVGLETADDAAVYKLSEEMAIIQTVDFFTPVIDDPYLFGQVAASNALSDIYAMGGYPLLALNIVCFPNCLAIETLENILRGGAEKVREAGAILAGGHTVQDDEPKYGLAVTGLVHPQQVITNSGARPGDVLILTKPLGTGIINTATKAGLAREQTQRAAIDTMVTLNKESSLAMQKAGTHACTDITGFGLLGHASEMAKASSVSLIIHSSSIPLLPEVKELASMGLIPGGAYSNRDFFQGNICFSEKITAIEQTILFDPQTSGGLLIALPEEKGEIILKDLETRGITASKIGRVIERQDVLIIVVE